MTEMLASVAGPDEAETAIAGGADIIDLKDPAGGALGALPLAVIRETVRTVAGRRFTSAVAGDLGGDGTGTGDPDRDGSAAVRLTDEIAASGTDYVKVGLPAGPAAREFVESLSRIARRSQLIAVLFADRERDPGALMPVLAASGWTGVMLDTADKARGRLLAHCDIPALLGFLKQARAHGLRAGLAGGLEEPDVPRLVAIEPDFLGFRGALCGGRDRKGVLDLEAVKTIRSLIPPTALPSEQANVDYRLLSARGYFPEADERDSPTERIFVRDFVLPVRIGAYSHERRAPQKVRFDVSVDVQRSRGDAKGMGRVFSYDLVTDGIAAIVAEQHVDLVEELAERIGAHVLRHPRAQRVTVRVEKLEMGPGGVGVEIVMLRPDRTAAGATAANAFGAGLEDGARSPRP